MNLDRMTFLDKLEDNFRLYGDRAALSGGPGGLRITYSELDRLSGKVFHDLKEKGIGPEDFVMVNLPRSAEILAVCVGVWRAGAAFTIREKESFQEKTDYIYENCGCKVLIDPEVFSVIQNYEPLPGHVRCSEHTAAYAVYTSGSTGKPKGVVHEIGTLINGRKSFRYNGDPIFRHTDRFAYSSPLNFAAAVMFMNPVLFAGAEFVVVPYQSAKNPMQMKEYFAAGKVTAAFLTPSYARIFRNFNPELKILLLAGETASNVYFDGLMMFNLYGQTETGSASCVFRIDRTYELTPIGKSQTEEIQVKLINEDGADCTPGEVGEICQNNEFFRGYIGLPKMTEEALRGGIYHTGDMGRYDTDGNIVLIGRNDDMVKINGNRVEPSEIESVVREELNIGWAAARCVKSGHRAVIYAYYNEELTVDLEGAKKRISQRLPSYMVPAAYIRIDKIPISDNGKLIRRELPVPVFKGSGTKAGSPDNELEVQVLNAFTKVLKVDGLGIDDDFFEAGGDSVASIELVAELGISGLSVRDIFQRRTVRRITERILELWDHEVEEDELDRQNAIAMKEEYPLGVFQTYMLDYQLYTPKSTMLNLPVFLKFGSEVDIGRLREALEQMIKAHPALNTRIRIGRDQDFAQAFCDEPFTVEPERVTEAAMIDIRESLISPFRLLDSPLFRCRLFETERGGYLFLDLHHIMGDGRSVHVILNDLLRAYEGYVLRTDRYYLYLKKRGEERSEAQYLEDQAYFEGLYQGRSFSECPTEDFRVRENKADSLIADIPIDGKSYEKIHVQYGLTNNAFFAAAALLALAQYNNARDVMITWTYHGRENAVEEKMVGLLIRDIPLGLTVSPEESVKDYLNRVQNAVNEGIRHSAYPYTLLNSSVAEKDRLCFLYQKDIFTYSMLRHGHFEEVQLPNHYKAAENAFNIEVIDNDGAITLSFDYASTRYRRSSVERFSRIYRQTALELALHLDDGGTIEEIIGAGQHEV